jgi:hypothetical protein
VQVFEDHNSWPSFRYSFHQQPPGDEDTLTLGAAARSTFRIDAKGSQHQSRQTFRIVLSVTTSRKRAGNPCGSNCTAHEFFEQATQWPIGQRLAIRHAACSYDSESSLRQELGQELL